MLEGTSCSPRLSPAQIGSGRSRDSETRLSMTEASRELSRLSRFSARFLGKQPTTNSRSLTISKTTYTPWQSPWGSNHRSTWCFPLVQGLDAARTPVFTTRLQLLPGQLPGVKIAVRNNRRKRALSATVLYWPASPTADESARVKRDVASRSETFRDKNILARPTLSTRILAWCATLLQPLLWAMFG
jgi:hypothetical protein